MVPLLHWRFRRSIKAFCPPRTAQMLQKGYNRQSRLATFIDPGDPWLHRKWLSFWDLERKQNPKFSTSYFQDPWLKTFTRNLQGTQPLPNFSLGPSATPPPANTLRSPGWPQQSSACSPRYTPGQQRCKKHTSLHLLLFPQADREHLHRWSVGIHQNLKLILGCDTQHQK